MSESDFLKFAHLLADRSAGIILPHFRMPIEVHDKAEGRGTARFDPVTAADRAAEQAIRALINEHYPDHGIIGEEFGNEREDAEYCWVIDPIDGTRSFIIGVPLWGTLIGLLREGRPYLGLMNQPFTGERYTGLLADDKGVCGAWYSGPGGKKQLKTRRCAALKKAVLVSTGPEFLQPGFETKTFNALKKKVRLNRWGTDCYAYCLLAAGHIDMVVEAGLKNYDIAPLIPIIEAAGGRVTAWDGGDASRGGRVLAAGDMSLHDKASDLTKEQEA